MRGSARLPTADGDFASLREVIGLRLEVTLVTDLNGSSHDQTAGILPAIYLHV